MVYIVYIVHIVYIVYIVCIVYIVAYLAVFIKLYVSSKPHPREDIRYAAMKATDLDFPPKQCISIPP